MRNLAEIKAHVMAGHPVYWKQENYRVVLDNIGQWLIVHPAQTIGLTHRDEVTMNGEAKDFYSPVPTYGDLYDLICEALPTVEEADPALYKPGYLKDLAKRIKAAIEGASV